MELRNERGFALVFALVFVFLLTLTALTFQGLGGVEADLVQRQVTHSEALYLAEAGLERARYALRKNRAWRGVDPPNGVAFAEGDRALADGSYDVLLYDGTDDGQGLYEPCLDPTHPNFDPITCPGEVRIVSTGAAGPDIVRSIRRIEARVGFESFRDIPSFFQLSGVLDKVKLKDDFQIDGHDHDPLTGNPEANPCAARHGIASQADVGKILEELQHRGTEDQVDGLGGPPSVAQVGQGVDAAELAGQMQDAAQGESFYHLFGSGDRKVNIDDDTTWGSYPNGLWVVRVAGELRVKSDHTLSGAGVLIVEDELKVYDTAMFNWKGLVIVLNQDGKDDDDAELEHQGSGTVYGALLVGGGNEESELELKPAGANFYYSCDALDAIADLSSDFSVFRRVLTRSWREVSP